MTLKLTLGYSTLAERVATLVEPPSNPDWEAVLVVQNPNQIDWQEQRFKELSARKDFRHHELELLERAIQQPSKSLEV